MMPLVFNVEQTGILEIPFSWKQWQRAQSVAVCSFVLIHDMWVFITVRILTLFVWMEKKLWMVKWCKNGGKLQWQVQEGNVPSHSWAAGGGICVSEAGWYPPIPGGADCGHELLWLLCLRLVDAVQSEAAKARHRQDQIVRRAAVARLAESG